MFSRFEDYINKSFNKTASLMAYSCQANAVLAEATTDEAHDAFLYGKHLGIAFQLVDDLLDFVSSADMLGKRQYNCKNKIQLQGSLLQPTFNWVSPQLQSSLPPPSSPNYTQ